MRCFRVGTLTALAVCAAVGSSRAQSTTGTIRGHVVDAQNLPLPGVTVTVTSASLQGTRNVVTSENGDYIVTSLPSGTYDISFELSGFQRQQRTVSVAPTQDLPVEITMGPAAVTEEIQVVGRAADVLTQTAQVATNFTQDLVSTLPTNRDINAYLLLAPAVHPTGPSGYYSIAGSVSFENLFLVNGVTVNENLRGQANDLYIEDAIQETTIATAGVSAEYGRFSGGVVNVVTKSGGNLFTGSFRETLYNDKWRTLTPFEDDSIAADPLSTDTRVSKVVPTHEYTLGGPILKDRLWFFTAGRIQTQSEGRQLAGTNVAYGYERPTRRYEVKATYSASSSHRIQGNYIKISDREVNGTFNRNTSMDTNSLYDRELPQDLVSVSYGGVLRPNLFVEGLFSRRHYTFVGTGATTTDPIDGTLMIDNSRGLRFWSPTFCGVCEDEQRDNQDLYGKASYFLSTSDAGSHNITFGADSFNDFRLANNHQSGSDYRIYNTGTILRGTGDATVIYPQSLGDTTTFIQFNPIPIPSRGSNFRTYSLFANDAWRINARLTANLGVRWDKNHGEDQEGNVVTRDGTISPRFGVVLDPFGDQQWSVTASFAKYVAAISNSVADSASAAGNPQTLRYTYLGPDINPNPNAATLTPTAQAVRQILDWYTANGATRLPLRESPNIPGVQTRIADGLKSPSVFEYATGVNRQFGNRAAVRADFVYRNYRDLYSFVTDTSTGRVSDAFGQQYDLRLVSNSNELRRRYSGLTTQGTLRFAAGTDIGGTYTLSHASGNFNGESVSGGPGPGEILQYPEYRQESWNYPEGDLQIDQRHRARLWINYGVPKVSGLTISLLQTLASGVPYGANNLNNTSANGVDSGPFVSNPGYVNPPNGSILNYFFPVDCSRAPDIEANCVGGQRDAFRTEHQLRTDFAASYTHGVRVGNHRLNLFIQAQIINLFNQFQLCGCGDTIFRNGGGVTQTAIDQTVRTNVSHRALYEPFNPFTTTPVQGTHWDYGPNFGKPLNRLAYTTPRQGRVTFGVRF